MTSLRYARGPLSSGRRFVRWMNHVRQVDSVLPADGGRPVRPTQTYGRASLHAISLTGTPKAPSGTNEDRASTLRLEMTPWCLPVRIAHNLNVALGRCHAVGARGEWVFA
jgi:hypothetical protein